MIFEKGRAVKEFEVVYRVRIVAHGESEKAVREIFDTNKPWLNVYGRGPYGSYDAKTVDGEIEAITETVEPPETRKRGKRK